MTLILTGWRYLRISLIVVAVGTVLLWAVDGPEEHIYHCEQDR